MVPINRPNHEPNVTCVKGHVAVVHGNLRATARAEKSLGDTGGLPFVQGGLQLSFEQRSKPLWHTTTLVSCIGILVMGLFWTLTYIDGYIV